MTLQPTQSTRAVVVVRPLRSLAAAPAAGYADIFAAQGHGPRCFPALPGTFWCQPHRGCAPCQAATAFKNVAAGRSMPGGAHARTGGG